MALTANAQRVEKEGRLIEFPVKTGVKIYKGALVKIAADGYLAPQAAEVGAVHAGVAYEYCDATGLASGVEKCRVETGRAFYMNGSGFTVADIGKDVFASDDNTISTTQGSNQLLVGKIIEFVSATEVLVLQAQHAFKA